MIPLVATRARAGDPAQAASTRSPRRSSPSAGRKVEYLVGTMIELPRAALLAGEIAEDAEFFSFGTNDLTQTTLGLSRDDAGSVPAALTSRRASSRAIRSSASTSKASGSSIALAAERGRATRPDLKLGICGEHGGDPASIAFCESVGLDYVSASPFRVPIAPAGRGAGGATQRGVRIALRQAQQRTACWYWHHLHIPFVLSLSKDDALRSAQVTGGR